MSAASAPTALIIEDNKGILRLLDALVKREGLQTCQATDGLDGLQQARAVRPRLILLDLILPVMSGYDVLAALRADPQTAGIPIVVVTTQERIDALDDEELEYVLKPFSPEELAAAVRRALARAAAGDSEGHEAAPGG